VNLQFIFKISWILRLLSLIYILFLSETSSPMDREGNWPSLPGAFSQTDQESLWNFSGSKQFLFNL